MSTRKLRQKDGAVYFATFTCHQWVELFRELNAYDIVYNWMHIAHDRGYRFMGYAIMPNHAHFVIRVPEGGAINTMLSNGKRFMAYALSIASQPQDDKICSHAYNKAFVQRTLHAGKSTGCSPHPPIWWNSSVAR